MTAKPSRLAAALYEAEASFAEDVDTFGTHLQLVGPPVQAFTQEKQTQDQTRQRPHESLQDVRMPLGGTLTTIHHLTGHGADPTGVLTATDLYDLLAIVIGGSDATDVGNTADGAGTVSAPGVNGGTFGNGGLVTIGDLSDPRGGGQAYAVDNLAALVLTLLTDLPATLNAGDVIHAMLQIFPSNDPLTSCAVTSTRWLIQSANKIFSAHGVFPTSISFSNLNTGQIPQVEIVWTVARWKEVAIPTFPTAIPTDAKTPISVGAGSLFFNLVGTSTRQELNIRDIEITINLDIRGIPGPGGVDVYQMMQSSARHNANMVMKLVADSQDFDFAALYTGDEATQAFEHILYTLTPVAGKAVAFYMRSGKIIQPRPTQVAVDDLNRVEVMFESNTHTVTTSDRTLSDWMLGMG